ncbi:alanine--glyoxylate aminotransferase family protein [Desulfococcaceae bacterium HSG8]|nr:alanine--glyoxylate aminotransferase family protein [Desulfococcaceae bacterium HSG8]
MKKNLLSDVQEKLLMGPGPSCVHPSVYEALSRPTIGHLDPDFIAIMDEIKTMLRRVLKTENNLTIPISGTGSAGMETCFVNLIEQGDAVLILTNGVFGKRMEDVAGRLGANVDAIEFAWGTPVVPEDVKKKLDARTYKIVAIVHAETSTGVLNPVAEVGTLLKGSESLYLVDSVTSLGGMDVSADEWGADVLYSGTQKCLSCPPGLSPVTFSDRAVEMLRKRKSKVPNWYLDLTLLTQYWDGAARVYHHTAPINMLYGLYQALYLILEEGPENVYARHKENHEKLISGLEELGLKMLVETSCRLPMLNSVCIPEGVNDADVRKRLLNEYRIEIGAGLGELAGKIWRIGLMGHTARPENVNRLLSMLSEIIRR